jgi:type 1 fimbriae regulatory protein FimE
MATATNLFAVPIKQPSCDKRNPKTFLTPVELVAVLRAARKNRTRDWCMILMAYRHGLRSAEVCGLKLSEVQSGAVSVQRLQGSLKTIQPLYRHLGEPLLDEVLALRAWLTERRPDPSDALFTSRKGGELDRTAFFRIFQAAAKAAGLSANKRHPRALRYSLASHLLASKVDVALVSQALGHRSINSTLPYTRFSDQEASEATQGALLRLF